MTTKPRLMALVAVGLLALGAMAAPAAAQDDADDRREQARERAEERREQAQERRQEARERAADARDAWKEHCRPEGNATLNETEQRRCMAVKEFFQGAHEARREGRALYGAIDAMERRIGRLEVREEALEQKLASGNFTGNETAASIQEKIDKIEAHQERMMERLEHLRERLEALHEKWQSVRDHVAERRHGGEDDEDDLDGESSSASSSSPSA
jgi:chromosome segregation ATPase